MALSFVAVDVGETLRRGAHAQVESPEGVVTIDSLNELPEALERV